jgi:hypothetical protein
MNDECNHEYKKTLAKAGMYFINMCHKCFHETTFTHKEVEDIIRKYESVLEQQEIILKNAIKND